jgi:hypothetical protein
MGMEEAALTGADDTTNLVDEWFERQPEDI